MNDHNLFVYDIKIGHNAGPYFDKNPHEWKDELKNRCWFVRPHYVRIVNSKKVVL